MNWYKTLDIHQKINLKELCVILVGAEFASLLRLFSFNQVVNILHQKLKIEGFDV